MRSLENGRNVIIKPEDKGSSIVVWDRLNYLAGAENQFSDSNTYKEVKEQRKNRSNQLQRATVCLKGLKRKELSRKKRKIILS